MELCLQMVFLCGAQKPCFFCFAFVLIVFIRRNKRDTFKNKAESLIVITLLRIDEITDKHCTQRAFNIAHK